MRNRLIIFLAIIAVIVAILFIAKAAGHGKHEGLAVQTITVRRSTFSVKLPENGVTQRPQAATVPALVGGNLGEIDVRAGQRVAAGELLATIVNPTLISNAAGSQADYEQSVASIETAKINSQNARVTYEADVQTAKSNLDEAKRIYDADVSLFAQKAIPRNQLDTDRAKLEQQQVAYDQAVRQLKLGAVTGYSQDSIQVAEATARKSAIVNAANQQQLGFTRVTAPFDGVIESVASQPNDPLTTIRPGDEITQGQELFTIARGDRFIVKAEVDEQDIAGVKVGQQAIVTSEDFPGKTIDGHVTFISPVATKSADATSTAKQVLTTIQLDSTPSYLRDGLNVDVDILTSSVNDALAVPSGAIATSNGKSYVFVVRGGTARQVFVRTGKANDTQTLILSGLRPGERVVSQQTPGLASGDPVTIVSPSPSPSPAS